MDSGKLWVFKAVGEEMELMNQKLPSLKAGEVLVRNLYTTICGSDLHTFCGVRKEKTPTVLGHEIVGKVVKISEDHSGKDHVGSPLAKGDIVTWSIFAANPASEMATKGMPQKSAEVFKYGHALLTEEDAFHGGLAEYTVLKAHTIVLKIKETILLPVAATINCAVATVAGALRLAGNLNNKKVLITGVGLLGVVCAAMCKDAGANKIVVADIEQDRLEQALTFGADEVYLMTAQPDDKSQNDLVALEAKIDVVFDMSGAPEAMEAGIEALAVGGVAVWVGAVFHRRKIGVDAEQIIRRLITIKGLHNYNDDDFVYAVDFITRNHQRFPFDTVVAKEFPLKEAAKAFEYALEYKPLRVGVRIE